MKTVLVTGVRTGIGLAIARQLLVEGYAVIGTSRQPQAIGIEHPAFTPLHLDLARLVADEAEPGKLASQCGDVDALVLNAGYGRFGGLEEFSHTQVNDLLAVDLTAQVQLVRAFISGIRKQNAGDIIFIGSEAALAGGKMGAVYSAAKFGIRGFAQALRQECAPRNIRVGLINPGMVASSFFDPLGFQPGPQPENRIQPQQVADAVAFMLGSSPNVVWDEINLSPLKKVVSKK